MQKQGLMISGAVAVALIAAVFAALYYDDAGDAPPLTGSVVNFIVAEDSLPAPEVGVSSADGGNVTLDRYRGELVVLNFWATWCGPCIRELPSLGRLAASLPQERARVVLLSQDRGGFDQVTPFLEKLGVDIADSFIDDKMAFSRSAGVTSLPTTILFAPDGRELGRLVGHAEWDSPEAKALIDYYLERS